ncbi:MAG: hypothetical protein ACK5NL_21105 [Vibrio fluvialis]
MVGASRTLAGSRYDLVNRNNVTLRATPPLIPEGADFGEMQVLGQVLKY